MGEEGGGGGVRRGMKVPLPISSNPSSALGLTFSRVVTHLVLHSLVELPENVSTSSPLLGDNAYRMGYGPDLAFSPPVNTKPCFYPGSYPLVP